MIFPILSALADRWMRFTILKVGIGAASYFTVNGGAPIAAEADQSQDIPLIALPGHSILENAFAKTAVAFTGATTAVLALLVTAAGTVANMADYDLKAAVADATIKSVAGINLSVAAQTVSARITVTVQTLQDLDDGCKLDIWLDVSRLIGW